MFPRHPASVRTVQGSGNCPRAQPPAPHVCGRWDRDRCGHEEDLCHLQRPPDQPRQARRRRPGRPQRQPAPRFQAGGGCTQVCRKQLIMKSIWSYNAAMHSRWRAYKIPSPMPEEARFSQNSCHFCLLTDQSASAEDAFNWPYFCTPRSPSNSICVSRKSICPSSSAMRASNRFLLT